LRILALTKYGDAAASTRQRFLQYRPGLEEAGFQLQVSPLLDNRHILGLTAGRRANPLSIGTSYARRLSLLMANSWHADALWVQYELFPYLPAVFERLAFRSGKPVVVDYDDAIFHMYDSNPFLRGKLRSLIAGASAITAGNDYLAEYALRWNSDVQVLPTVVDTSLYVPARRSENAVPVIGWIGSPSTWSYTRPLLPVVEALCKTGRAQFLAVGGGAEAERDLFSGMELRNWAEDREIADVQSMDIGIMPLPDEPWARGKCGYKLIQYMACGLPTVASPVGVNREIVLPGKTGVLAADLEDWRIAMAQLLGDPSLRQGMGKAGRERATALYSLATQAPRVVEVMQRAVRRG
jgi:glycosyltransferase involved in cell wall biosynthesis